ncbi:MAG: DUF799 family lipoprotein [Elusimicrobia bacterium]|nr:DUF799 family lipoprotein [Elusimicrobiota bacterium]
MISTRRCLLVVGATAAIFGGCAVPVYINHYKAPNRLDAGHLGALKRVYVAVVPPDQHKKSAAWGKGLNKFINSLAEKKEMDPNERWSDWKGGQALALGQAAARAISGSFGGAIAVQAGHGEKPPGWIGHLGATSSLWIFPQPLILEKEPRQVDVRDKSGNVIGKRTEWALKKKWRVKYGFFAEPGGKLIFEAPFEAEQSDTMADEPDLDKLLAVQEKSWVEAWARTLAVDLLPHEVRRVRALYKGKSPKMKEAQKLARSGQWDQAEVLWKEENSPEARFNIAVSYERRGLWSEAKAAYESAANTGGNAAHQASAALSELGVLMPSAPATSEAKIKEPPDIFAAQWAVLPMNNETNDLDGPAHVRAVLESGLGQMGLALVNPEEVDVKLKSQGITDGGQLGSMKPKDIGKLLGANYLIYPVLEEYRSIPLAVYYKRVVAVRWRIVHAATGGTLAEQAETIVYQGSAPPNKAAEALVVQLAGRQISKLTKTYLKKETEEVVAALAAGLPHKP